MRRQHKLRNTIIIYFCLFGLVLTALYGTVIFLGMRQLEDRVFTNQLQSIVENYLKGVANGNPQLSPPGLTTYRGTEQMPDSLFDLVGRYPLGYHELHFNQSDTEVELQFAIQQPPGKEERVYFIYDVSGLEVTEQKQHDLVLLLLLAGTLVCCLGLVIGFFLARRITTPLSELTRKIQSFSGNDLPTKLITPGASDEISVLGHSLEHANERINQFIIREKEFTRNASHELRTPLTVIKGATELLEKRLSAEGINPRALDRISRSIGEMELTINTFLMLAREDNVPSSEKVDLGKLCSNIAGEIRFLIIEPGMDIQVRCEEPVFVYASPQVIRIILSNLLRNAVQHSFGKDITVQVNEGSLQVTDDGWGITNELSGTILQPGIRDKKSDGTGFGLSIVDRICTRLGWLLEVTSSRKAGTKITVFLK